METEIKFNSEYSKADEELLLKIIDSNTIKFMNQVLHVKNFGKYSCVCPFHHSKDGDFSYNKKTKMWRCWGKCDSTFNNAITVVACLNNDLNLKQFVSLSKQERKILYIKAFNFLKRWIMNDEVTFVEEDEIDTNLKNALLRVKDANIESPNKTLYDFNYALALRNSQVKDYADKYFIKDNPDEELPYLKTFELLYSKKNAELVKLKRFSPEAIKEYRIYTYRFSKNIPAFLKNYYFYPIYDENANLIASQGRKYSDVVSKKGFTIPKMYNPKGFSKNKVLFGLTQVLRRYNNEFVFKGYCDNELRLMNPLQEIMIHEGPADTVKAFEHGYKNSISLLGKTISDDQIKILKKVLDKNARIIVFLDADEPGREASKKIIATLKENGFTNIYEGKMITGEKDVGDSTKEHFITSYRNIQRII